MKRVSVMLLAIGMKAFTHLYILERHGFGNSSLKKRTRVLLGDETLIMD